MKRDILKYLYSFKDREYHEVNDFVREKGWESNIGDVRNAFQRLKDTNKIDVFNCSSIRWGQYSKIIEISETQNIMATLDNWKLKARLTENQRDQMEEEEEQRGLQQKIHINENSGVIIQGSDFREAEIKPINAPIIAEITHPKSNAVKKVSWPMQFWKFISKNALIASILSGLIVWLIIYILFGRHTG